MSVDPAIETIRKLRQTFAYGVAGIHTLFSLGSGGAEVMKPLRTDIEEDLVHIGWFLPRVKLNTQLEQAAANRLAMQLMVGAGDAVSRHAETWVDNPEPEIQFLRQIRNGAAHNNRLEFRSTSDPRPHTRWNDFEITENMEGTVIFTDSKDIIWDTETVEMEEGFFQAGDALSLTTDILEILIEDSDTFGPENIIGLPKDSAWDQ